MVAIVSLCDMTFGEKLLNARKLAGLSQEELAQACGSYQSRITKWESNIGNPSVEQLHKLVAALRVRIRWLTSDYLIDPEADEPAEPSSRQTDEEILLWVLVRDIGAVEARRRILGITPNSIAIPPTRFLARPLDPEPPQVQPEPPETPEPKPEPKPPRGGPDPGNGKSKRSG